MNGARQGWLTSEAPAKSRTCSIWLTSLLWLAAVCASTVQGQEPSAKPTTLLYEARAVWGGGPMRTFTGKISIKGGTLEVLRNLSVQDDAVGSIQRKSSTEVLLLPHVPSNFGGIDLLLRGPAEAELTFEFNAVGNGESKTEAGKAEPPAPQTIRTTLGKLLRERELQLIDANGSRLAVERPTHDRIRARIAEGRTIFSPGERVVLGVEGYRTSLAAGEYRINLRMLDLANMRSVAHWQQDIDIDDQGNFAAQTFRDIEAPTHGGAFAFDISLQRRRLINSFINAINVEDRKLEFVVVEKTPPPSGTTQWRELAQLYPAGTSWWDSLGKFRVPTVKTLTPLVTHTARPLSSSEHRRRTVGTSECMVLGKGAWQAFPLSINNVGSVHRLRIKVPADVAQKMVFSLQETSPVSDPSGLRPDSGLIIDPSTVANGEFATHELLFWPKSTQPYLLVMNADPLKDASIAEIELDMAETGSLVSPTRLQPSISKGDAPSTRLCGLYFDKPLLAENFGAARRLESKGRRELDSFETVYQSSTRLADYTQWSGFNAATITVATQGGAIFPSETLKPSPKFDSGTFLADGSAPDIKDQVEVLCREFDRRGLRLILALDLEGALPGLDRASALQNSTLMQVPLDSGEGSDPTSQSTIIRFNPLDARVQTAIEKVIGELLDRYANHPAFAGIQLNLSDRSHVNFAGDLWGYDEAAIARFERSLGNALPKDAQERRQLLSRTLRLNFTRDRAEQLAGFYCKLADRVCAARADARLILNPARLLSSPPTSDRFSSVESQSMGPAEVLLGCGIDSARLAMFEKLCLLRPVSDSPLRTPIARSWSYQLSSDALLDSSMTGANAGAILQQVPTSFRLPDFDKVNPIGNDKNRTWLFPHSSYAGAAARRGLCNRLYHNDTWLLTNGGWLAAMGQETAVRPLLNVLTQLPPTVMQDVPTPSVSSTIKIRQSEMPGKSYLQFINNASWQEKLFIEIRAERDLTIEDLSSTGVQPQSLPAGQTVTIPLKLEAYSLAGWSIDGTEYKITRVTNELEPSLVDKMERRLNELQSCIDRAGELNEQQTLGLRGGDFEEWTAEGKPVGWTISTHPSTSIVPDGELPRSGNRCLRIENKGNGTATAWVQSDRIAIPTTGRLALEAWVRTAPGQPIPTVRLSLIGRTRDGRRFQRWHEFSSPAGDSTSISVDWGRKPLVLLVPDVPNESLTELHVAIDLMEPGRLWLDDVRVYGMYLHPEEKVHLLGQMFLAKERLRKGDFTLAEQLLESFWANFLTTYLVTPPATSDSPEATGSDLKVRLPSSPPAWRSSATPRQGSWYENLRGRWQR